MVIEFLNLFGNRFSKIVVGLQFRNLFVEVYMMNVFFNIFKFRREEFFYLFYLTFLYIF